MKATMQADAMPALAPAERAVDLVEDEEEEVVVEEGETVANVEVGGRVDVEEGMEDGVKDVLRSEARVEVVGGGSEIDVGGAVDGGTSEVCAVVSL